MKIYNIKISAENHDASIPEDIQTLVTSYLAEKNVSGNCTIQERLFLSLYCKDDSGIVKQVRQEDIIYIEKSNHKVMLYTKNGCFCFYSSLKKLEQKLDPDMFFRVHQGYIVNLNEIKMIYSNELSLMSTDTNIPVSRRNRARLNERLFLS